jgi:hypothetical protein
MRMSGTRKRIEALERSLPPRLEPGGADDETVRAALQLLSDEDLEALQSAAEAESKRDGSVPSEHNPRSMQAQRAFARAIVQVQYSGQLGAAST